MGGRDGPESLGTMDRNQWARWTEIPNCQASIQTSDGIRVYFAPAQFDHSFYESSQRDGKKDVFSAVRAQRIDWIKATLEHPTATLLEGWEKVSRTYDARRRVAVVYEEFVVIVSMGLKGSGELKAKFVTCYQADNSIKKILTAPQWSKDNCMRALTPKS
nr:hypothetical protein [uncultured Duganella sp.]